MTYKGIMLDPYMHSLIVQVGIQRAIFIAKSTKTALIPIGMVLEYFEKPRKYTIVTTL